MKTGWPPGMLQDDDNRLSRWLANRPGARYQVRKNMTEQQPEARRLADELHDWGVTYAGNFGMQRMLTGAAAELRRLHGLNQQLLEALEDYAQYGMSQKARAAIAAAKELT